MSDSRPLYLDHNATTMPDPRVVDVMVHYLREEFGNAGSRTHSYGAEALKAVQLARGQVAKAVASKPADVIFTSGATESNNIAILGLADHGLATNKKHIVSTHIEHMAVLEPLQHLAARGFEVELVSPQPSGCVDPDEVAAVVRGDTLLVSVMHVNNETGHIQPLDRILDLLQDHSAFIHTDAAQGFGKLPFSVYANPRLDLISISGHKIYGPKGVGALVARKRGYSSCPLQPLVFGGGQERGLRPGTVPVHLVAGLGRAAELALAEQEDRREACLSFERGLLGFVKDVGGEIVGAPAQRLYNSLSFYLEGFDSDALMIVLRDFLAISNGSACTSDKIEPSHVLLAMGLPEDVVSAAVRVSWSHQTVSPNWAILASQVKAVV